jgi:hypothetical protein
MRPAASTQTNTQYLILATIQCNNHQELSICVKITLLVVASYQTLSEIAADIVAAINAICVTHATTVWIATFNGMLMSILKQSKLVLRLYNYQ